MFASMDRTGIQMTTLNIGSNVGVAEIDINPSSLVMIT